MVIEFSSLRNERVIAPGGFSGQRHSGRCAEITSLGTMLPAVWVLVRIAQFVVSYAIA